VFAGLSEAELGAIAARSGTGRLAASAALMTAGQPGELCYVLLEGTVRVQVEAEDGSWTVLGYLGPGDIIGELSLLDGDARSATVEATEPGAYLWVDRATLAAAIDSSPRFARNLLALLGRRLRQANARILAMATQDVAGRVVAELLGLATAFGEPLEGGAVRINLRITQADLAALTGASREHINRVMKQLQVAGLVQVDARHRITLVDPQKLRRRYHAP
jgi:CRP-like cAMP-binding protein